MRATNFLLSDLRVAQPIQGWEEFRSDGNAFLKTAAKAHAEQKSAFTAEILYNVIAMAIEKFVMAALMRHGELPYNHTMTDLVEAMEKTFPGAIKDLAADLLALDRYQEICDIDAFNITPPEMAEIPGMINLAGKLQVLVAN